MVNLIKPYFVYIVTNRPHGTLYTGVTNNLPERAHQHRKGLVEGFSKKYHLKMLVYYETHLCVEEAILREKQIKRWKRIYKFRIIERMNPEWDDLYDSITEEWIPA